MVSLSGKRNKKGFTMLELLAVIVILGIVATISIVSVQRLLVKAKAQYYKSQEESMVMAGQNYLEANKTAQPKISGQLIKLELKSLRNSKYIENVVDYSKKECNIDNSYVQVFKYKDELRYMPYLDCLPDYKTDLNADDKKPNIVISYLEAFTSKPKVEIKLKDEHNGLFTYYYKIYKDDKLVYSSDNIDGKGTTEEIKKMYKLNDYVPGKIKVVVTAINTYGNSITKSATQDFADKTPPICKNIIGDSTTWTTGSREISVECDDGNGIGCKKQIYTKKFSSDTRVGIITIEDKAGNKTDCNVNVYIDKAPPSVTVKIYKRESNGEKIGSPIQTKQTKGSEPLDIEVIEDNVGGWLNKENYPSGVIIEANYEDSVNVSKIEWRWNASGLKKTDSNVNTYPEGKLEITEPNKQKGKYLPSLIAEGYRKAQMIISDEAGNKATINLTVPMDRTAPTKPVLQNSHDNKWVNFDYSISGTTTEALSGIRDWAYSWSSQGKYETYANSNKTSYTTTNFSSDINQDVYIRACDVAGNCSEPAVSKIKIDKQKPTCTKSGEGSPADWASSRTIKIACKDQAAKVNSGCTMDSSTEEEITTYTETKDYILKDNAGNISTCTADIYVNPKDSIVVKIYKLDNKGNATGNPVKTAVIDDTDIHEIQIDKDTVGNDKWLNATNYPYGIYIEYTYSGTKLDTFTWKYNDANIAKNSSDVNNLSNSNSVTVNETSWSGGKKIGVDGYRKAQMIFKTVTGKVYKTNYTVPLDKTAPKLSTKNLGSVSNTVATQKVSATFNDLSGVATASYCIKYNDSANPTTDDDKCFKLNDTASNSSTGKYTRNCNQENYFWVVATDKAGNKTEIINLGNNEDGENKYGAWPECTKYCGKNAYVTRTNSCALVTSDRKKSCQIITNCPKSLNCKYYGKLITNEPIIGHWDNCTGKHAHDNSARIHYCLGADGTVYVKSGGNDFDRNKKLAKKYDGINATVSTTMDASYACPNKPYADWTLITMK